VQEERQLRGMTARKLNLHFLEEDADSKNIEFSTRPGAEQLPDWSKRARAASVAALKPRMGRCREVFEMVGGLPCMPYLKPNISSRIWENASGHPGFVPNPMLVRFAS